MEITGNVQTHYKKANTAKKSKARFIIAVLMLTAIVVNYLDRTVMSAAAPEIMRDLNINATEMGYIMSMFFFSYALMQIPAGWIGDKFGQKITMAIAVVWWSLATAATAGCRTVSGFIGARIFMGVGESGVYPCNAGIAAKWFPDHERGKITALFDSGSKFGTAFAMPLVAWLIAMYGWHFPFLICGALGLVWVIVWFMVYDEPERNKFINEAERKYIRDNQVKKEGLDKTQPMKWYQLLKHRNVLSMCFGFFCLNYAIYFFITWFPTYLIQGRGMKLMTMGWMAMLPPLCGIVGQYIGGWFTDYYYQKTGNLTKARKINIVIGMLLGTLVAFSSLAESSTLCLALLCVSYAGLAFAASAIWSLPGDVAPRNMTSVLAGIQNCASNMGGFISPIVTGYIVATTHDFLPALAISGFLCFLGAINYALFLKDIKPIEAKDV